MQTPLVSVINVFHACVSNSAQSTSCLYGMGIYPSLTMTIPSQTD